MPVGVSSQERTTLRALVPFSQGWSSHLLPTCGPLARMDAHGFMLVGFPQWGLQPPMGEDHGHLCIPCP